MGYNIIFLHTKAIYPMLRNRCNSWRCIRSSLTICDIERGHTFPWSLLHGLERIHHRTPGWKDLLGKPQWLPQQMDSTEGWKIMNLWKYLINIYSRCPIVETNPGPLWLVGLVSVGLSSGCLWRLWRSFGQCWKSKGFTLERLNSSQ
jgi:hypothetical protein